VLLKELYLLPHNLSALQTQISLLAPMKADSHTACRSPTLSESKEGIEEPRNRGLQYVVLLTTKILGALPIKLRTFVGWSLGYLVGLLPIRDRKFTLLQLKVFLPQVSATLTAPRVFANVGRTLFESLNLRPFLNAGKQAVHCENLTQIKEWTKEERPIIALTAHTGNWDLLAAWVISEGIPLTTIGREARSPSAQAVLKSIRNGYGIETIWRSDRSGMKRLISCLKERRVVAALIDQDTRVESIAVPFFGQSVKTPVSLITLGLKMNARFVSAFIVRTGGSRFTLSIAELDAPRNEFEILLQYNSRLEEIIRKHPDQWVWFHKRWRSKPNGATLSSKEYETELRRRVGNYYLGT
jgi:KDO2-lipid IV(A) lauroyltransferase